jgi:bifunctional non-homologous end joining protein LigD
MTTSTRKRPGALLAPMLAATGDLPTDDVRWSFELKWDGMRALAAGDGQPATLTLWTRNQREVAEGYPELAPLGAVLAAHGAVVDGEIVALDEHGRPDFSRLQRRLHATGTRVGAAAAAVPVVYLVFDLLELHHAPLVDEPYYVRRRLLEDLAGEGHGPLTSPAWAVPPAFERGQEALSVARQRELEGVVAKRLDSRYTPGRRSPLWRKVVLSQRDSFVVGGWRPGEGARRDLVAALLTGRYDDDGRLVYTGAVGSGLADADLDHWQSEVTRMTTTTSPFAGRQPAGYARFLRPEAVIDVSYRELTPAGTLRHPVYRGSRPDLDPADIRHTPPVMPERKRARRFLSRRRG